MPAITCIEDLRHLAQKRTPRMFLTIAKAGMERVDPACERSRSQSIKFRQRVAVDVDKRTTATKMLGEDVAMPVALAPTGLTGMQHVDGEILRFRLLRHLAFPLHYPPCPSVPSRMWRHIRQSPSGSSFGVATGNSYRLIERARAAQCSALVITVDLQIMGQRHRDVKTAFGTAETDPANMINLVTKPGWCRRCWVRSAGISAMSSAMLMVSGMYHPLRNGPQASLISTLSWG